MDGWDGWMDGWMDGWTDPWIGRVEWMDAQINGQLGQEWMGVVD